jgi:hypothetical protein
MPRNTIFVEERKEIVTIAEKAFLKFDGGFRCVGSVQNMALVEVVDRGVEFLEMSAFQAIRFYRLKDGDEEVLHLEDERLEFEVKRIAPQLVVEIADEMDQAFLLAACDGIIPRIEIRDEHTLIVL